MKIIMSGGHGNENGEEEGGDGGDNENIHFTE